MSTPGQCNILDLNDDCFYHVYEFLPIGDWCSLRDTCTRFRAISDFWFERRSETFELKRLSLSEAKRVLRCFGRFMKTLSLDYEHFRRFGMMMFLNRYCQSLDLELLNCALDLADVEQCSRLFSSLHRLMIEKWSNEEAFTSSLAHCTSLKELEFIRLTNITANSLAHCRLMFLESFNLSRCRRINYEAVKSFLTLNCQLTRIKLFDLYFQYGHDATGILEHVSNALPKLEALSLHLNSDFQPNLLPVTGMTLLKKLEVNLELVKDNIVNQVLQGLAVHKIIEELHLAQFKCTDESIGLLASLKSLKILKFSKTDRLDGGFCKTLASELPGLDEIHIFECKDTSFSEVKEFVASIPTLGRVVFNRPKECGPSIVREMFSSLVEIRKRQATKVVLLIFLNNNDLRHSKHQFKSTVLKILPLDKVHRRAVSEYGSGVLSTHRCFTKSDGCEPIESYSDSYDNDDDCRRCRPQTVRARARAFIDDYDYGLCGTVRSRRARLRYQSPVL